MREEGKGEENPLSSLSRNEHGDYSPLFTHEETRGADLVIHAEITNLNVFRLNYVNC